MDNILITIGYGDYTLRLNTVANMFTEKHGCAVRCHVFGDANYRFTRGQTKADYQVIVGKRELIGG